VNKAEHLVEGEVSVALDVLSHVTELFAFAFKNAGARQ
jgi:hypothetical protein